MASVWYLVVAGGGGGGSYAGGGGGAGGFRTNGAINHVVSVQAYPITVGGGGNGAPDTTHDGTNGSDSVFDTITSTGGGRGGSQNKNPASGANGQNGGSGGGGGGPEAGATTGGSGTPGQGNNGGTGEGGGAKNVGGGGGGASAVGGNGNHGAPPNTGGNGGDGTASTISGSSATYAGGGGGGAGNGAGNNPGSGGAGGGGAGGKDGGAGTAGTANTGGGGGGSYTGAGGAGGSGIVILRYTTGTIVATGGTITTSGSDTIHTFTGSGTFDVTSIPIAPVADFSGTPTSGNAPLTVAFADLSTNTPTSWLWDFGDGQTSTSQNPSHTYQSPGAYTVSLTATNAAGSDARTKTNYISVASGRIGPARYASDRMRRDEEELREIIEAVTPYLGATEKTEIEL